MPAIVTYDGDGEYHDTMKVVNEVDGKPHSPGKLVAWDPVAQRARWSVDQALPVNGGVLATAGGLVFQGDAQGRFSAYDSSSGERLWSVTTGSAIDAAPVSYRLGGTQYVLVAVGAGGGMQLNYPTLYASADAHGPARLMAFAVGAAQTPPAALAERRALPVLAPVTAKADVIEKGAYVYATHCVYCHGADAQAKYGGTVPDLRYASPETHAAWSAIVIGGARRDKGMPPADIDAADAEAVRQYVLRQAHRLAGD